MELNFDFTMEHELDHKVTFSKTDDGSTVVRANAKGAKLTGEVKTSNLADLLGDRVWAGDIFGTGETTKVSFTHCDHDDNDHDD